MIVNSGKDTVKQFFGQQVGQIGDYLAFGTGTTAETLTDTALEAEVYRVSCTSVNADLANSRIVFKAVIPAGMLDQFTELGLFYDGGSQGGGTLVSRVTFTTPEIPDPNLPTDVEYSIGISV